MQQKLAFLTDDTDFSDFKNENIIKNNINSKGNNSTANDKVGALVLLHASVIFLSPHYFFFLYTSAYSRKRTRSQEKKT